MMEPRQAANFQGPQMGRMPHAMPVDLNAGMMRPGPMLPMDKMVYQMGYTEEDKRVKYFEKGVYVTGFEKTVTAAMLIERFKIKPIDALKLPTSKFGQNKGYAFIYYKSPDDARAVKERLDHSVILLSKIRVTRIVFAKHLSKMMVKLQPSADQSRVKEYFTEENLEKEFKKVIDPIFKTSIEVNKISISTNENKTLKYGKVYFYVKNLGEAAAITRQKIDPAEPRIREKSKEYDIVLSYIARLINQEESLSSMVFAEIYRYFKSNQTNVLHFIGLQPRENQLPVTLAEEFKEFVQQENKQVNIIGQYAQNTKLGAWANLTFISPEEAVQVFQHFKNNQIRFRGSLIQATLSNFVDERTIVASQIRSDVDKESVKKFFQEIADNSPRVDVQDESKGKKFDFFSINLLEEKKFYLTNNEQYVSNKTEESWREHRSLPRRIVIHFLHGLNQEGIVNLTATIRTAEKFNDIFTGASFLKVRVNTQKGHYDKSGYHRHLELPKEGDHDEKKKSKRYDQSNRQNRPIDGSMYRVSRNGPGMANKAPGKGQVPHLPPQNYQMGKLPMQGQMRIPLRHNLPYQPVQPGSKQSQPPVMGVNRPTGDRQQGKPTMKHSFTGNSRAPPMPMMGQPMPAMGGQQQMPMMGQPMPAMGGQQMPMMGQSMPAMGGQQMPMMGQQMPPMGGQQMPMMGQQMPPMGGQQMPMMGQSMPAMGSQQMPMMGQQMPPMGQPGVSKTSQQPPSTDQSSQNKPGQPPSEKSQ